MELMEIVTILNILVVTGLFVATLYRIHIEKKQIEWLIDRRREEDLINSVRHLLKTEREHLLKMTSKEFIEMLELMVNGRNEE